MRNTFTALMSALFSGFPSIIEIFGMFLSKCANNKRSKIRSSNHLSKPHSRTRKVMFPTIIMWRRSAYGMFEALRQYVDNRGDNGRWRDWWNQHTQNMICQQKGKCVSAHKSVSGQFWKNLESFYRIMFCDCTKCHWNSYTWSRSKWVNTSTAWPGFWAQEEDCHHQRRCRSLCVRQTWSPSLLACEHKCVCKYGPTMTDFDDLVNFRPSDFKSAYISDIYCDWKL